MWEIVKKNPCAIVSFASDASMDDHQFSFCYLKCFEGKQKY